MCIRDRFIKSAQDSAERTAFSRFANVEFHTIGAGFTWLTQDRDRDIAAAGQAWAEAERMIGDPRYQLVILDELNPVLHYGYLEGGRVLEALDQRRTDRHLSLIHIEMWRRDRGNTAKSIVAPLSLIISAFSPVQDVRRTLTPQLRTDCGDTDLLLIDLGRGKNRLGGSVLEQVYHSLSDAVPDVDSANDLKAFFATIQDLNATGRILAYHDRSDGGLLAVRCV